MIKDVVIKSTKNKGLGLFTNSNFIRGEVVVRGRVIAHLSARTMHSFQTNINTHVQLDKASRSINHSCDPNTGVQANQFGAYNFVALRYIKKGEEITWDYETTEFVSISVQECLCKSQRCRKVIPGFKYHPEELLKQYGVYLASYLREMYKENEIFACTGGVKQISLELEKIIVR